MFLILFTVYTVAGCAYNIKYRGGWHSCLSQSDPAAGTQVGIDSMPNLNFWKEVKLGLNVCKFDEIAGSVWPLQHVDTCQEQGEMRHTPPPLDSELFLGGTNDWQEIIRVSEIRRSLSDSGRIER